MDNESPKSPTRLRFVIAGAGLGGLATSIGLAKAGHEIEILEQSLSLREIGAGIQIPPNATAVLRRLGVLREIEKYAIVPNSIAMHRYSDGAILSEQNLLPHCGTLYGSPYLLVRRADLHYVLVSAAKLLGVNIRLKSTVRGVDFAKPGLILDKEEVVEGDVVIAADGLRSQCREAFLGKKDPPVPSGTLVYRATLNPAKLMQHEDLESLVDYPEFHCWIGPHVHVVFFPLREGEPCNLVVLAPDTISDLEDSSQANLEEMKELMKNWEPRIQKLLGMVTSISKWRLQDNVEIENWTSGQGTFTMIGDACHATIPYLAQGAAQAIEDAGTLTVLFQDLKLKEDVPDILRTYEQIRKLRTTRLLKESIAFRTLCQVEDGPEQEIRDLKLLEEVPSTGCANRWADPGFQRWLWGHDVEEAVRLYKHHQ